jgi:uncharacterized protein (DUF2062 family)/SAM-dependent methyltransferase
VTERGKQALRAHLAAAWRRLRGGELSPVRASASVAVGFFVAALPIYGFQLFLVLAICVPLRLDAAVAYVAAHVANPFTLPLFVAIELEIGALLLTGRHTARSLEEASRIGLGGFAAQLACGALVIGFALAVAGAVATLALTRWREGRRHDVLAEAVRRTVARYARAPVGARAYVQSKLRDDPALRTVLSLEGSFGRLVDAGCGFGQLGLCILELGRADSVSGFDADPERVEVARAAAQAEAHFEVGDLTALSYPAADTVLLFDTLHYLPLDQHASVLEHAARALAPGGRLILRDIDARTGWRSWMTIQIERLAARLRGQRVRGLRAMSDVIAELEALGLTCTIVEAAVPSPYANVVIVAERTRE